MRWRPVLIAAAVAGGLLVAAPAQAQPVAPPPVVAADTPTEVPLEVAVPPATQEDKFRAAAVLGIVAGDDLLVLSDRNFVIALWRRATGAELRASAELAFAGTDQECSQWIRTGIHEAKRRDDLNEIRDAERAREARELKQSAAAVIGIVAEPELLIRGYKDFVFALWERATGPKVKAAALAAFGGTEQQQIDFLRTGIGVADAQDKQDKIDQDEQASEAEKARQKARNAKARAMAVLGVIATPGMLELSDDNFVREVWNRATQGTEVHDAAVDALRSPDPAVWKWFIDTGIYEADGRDTASKLRKEEEDNRRRALEIQTKAEKSLIRPGLVYAAKAALAGTPKDVADFLRIGQYRSLIQSLRSDRAGRRGHHVRPVGAGYADITAGPQIPGGGAGADASWRVMPGLGNPDCYSFESMTQPGVYLRVSNFRVRVEPTDGTTVFHRDATWCPKPGLMGVGVSLESFSNPGRYLRQFGGALFAADNSRRQSFDHPDWFTVDASWRINWAYPVTTAIELRWLNDTAARDYVCEPADTEKTDGMVRYRDYRCARMYWAPTHHNFGPKIMTGHIHAEYLRLGGHTSARLGLPVTDELDAPDKVGRYNTLSNAGAIYWSPSTGAHAMFGSILSTWYSLGGVKSSLKYPISAETDIPGLPGGKRTLFQGGRIDYDPATGKATPYPA
ncbi:AbfB domain-containing protein [Amycolatopsis suaedae]|uniref:Alpha-L-arabinofuranosidase B arabinose-binding domain-containing protein n=1 Tax=Amycolatopsis suaedae TaxID=2510978 RepID=A0A4Q7J526_9PSEU|nr:AbfB domain-containing protein [Amycolatopsis suaedae]RZQ61403.1 hypothetical protein EWH70_23775 [Amycolatopsis suaedae]